MRKIKEEEERENFVFLWKTICICHKLHSISSKQSDIFYLEFRIIAFQKKKVISIYTMNITRSDKDMQRSTNYHSSFCRTFLCPWAFQQPFWMLTWHGKVSATLKVNGSVGFYSNSKWNLDFVILSSKRRREGFYYLGSVDSVEEKRR